MKNIFLLILLLSGCSSFTKPSHQITYWKPMLTELNDIAIIKLTSGPLGPIWKNEAVYNSDKKEDALTFYHYLFGDHLKKADKKGAQTWKYVIYFHKGESGFKEHKIRVSEEGITYEGAFYPFQSKSDQEELFQLLEDKVK